MDFIRTIWNRARNATASTPTANQTWSTPVKGKASATKAFSTHQLLASGRKVEFSEEMADKFVGPMPVDQFFNEFLPVPDDHFVFDDRIHKGLFEEVTKKGTENEMYGAMIQALTPFCGTFQLIDTHHKPDSSFGTLTQEKLKPDVTLYRPNCGRVGSTDLSTAELTFEFKNNTTDDAFCDTPSEGNEDNFVRTSQSSKQTAGQLTSYAVSQFASQFRTHLFSILILKTHARLIYWDRAGVVVTQQFPLTDHYLAKFIWIFTRATPEQRGIDTTVKKPSPEEIAEARVHLDRGAKKSTPDSKFFKFEVRDDENEIAVRYFIGKRPVFKRDSSLVGRASRGYIVWDPIKKIIMFMKDTWRLALPGIDKEGKIYRELHNVGVQNIAPFECAGDLGHETRTQTYTVAKWAKWARKRALRRHVHYRLVLGVVGRDLTSYRSTKELVTAMRDAMIAHEQILKVGIIHRDISVGNILILDDGHGILIDFDLCKRFEDMKKQARASERSGTWQFMSARLQMSPLPLHPERADDLESFLHVLAWIALRYVPHTLNACDLTNYLSQVFDFTNVVDGITTGGKQKRDFLKAKTISVCGFKESPLLSLLEELTETFAARYDKVNRPTGPNARNSSRLKEWTYFEELRQRLDSSKWAIQAFSEALKDPDWPINDVPLENPLLPRIEQHAKVHTSHTQVQSTLFGQMQVHASQNASEDRMDVDSPQSPRKTAPLPRRAQQVIPGPVPTFNGETRQDWGAASDTAPSGKRSRAAFEPPPSPSNKCARTAQHSKPRTNPR